MNKHEDALRPSLVRIMTAGQAASRFHYIYYDTTAIRNLVNSAFSIEALQRFISDELAFRNVGQNISKNPSLAQASDELLKYCEEFDLLDELLLKIRNRNPRQYEKHKASLWNNDVPLWHKYQAGIRHLSDRIEEGRLSGEALDLLRGLYPNTQPSTLAKRFDKLTQSALQMSFADLCELIASVAKQRLAGNMPETVVGTGFLVDGEVVLTHVETLAKVRALSAEPLDPPPTRVNLDFPLITPGPTLAAHSYDSLQQRTVVSLALDDELPHDARPVNLTDEKDLHGHHIWTLNFSNYGNEVWASGKVGKQSDTGWELLEDEQRASSFSNLDFGGAPAWDEGAQAVVGLVLTAQECGGRAAYIIPTHLILNDCPNLKPPPPPPDPPEKPPIQQPSDASSSGPWIDTLSRQLTDVSAQLTALLTKQLADSKDSRQPDATPTEPLMLNQGILFGALWGQFVKMADAVSILDKQNPTILFTLEEELSGVCKLINEHSTPEKWQPLKDAIVGFYQRFCPDTDSSQANRSIRQLCGLVAQLVSRLKTYLPAELLPSFETLAKQLQDFSQLKQANPRS